MGKEYQKDGMHENSKFGYMRAAKTPPKRYAISRLFGKTGRFPLTKKAYSKDLDARRERAFPGSS
jgi:hypothetical protein